MGATFVKKDEKVYTQKIHRDVRSFSNNKKIMLIAIILLDDSNEKNGATWILSGNFKTKSKPTKKYFYNNADRINGKKEMLFYLMRSMACIGKKYYAKSKSDCDCSIYKAIY